MTTLAVWSPPQLNLLLDATLLLMIPQLPLTLGNAVYAASDTCHTLWPDRAQRVSPKRLAFSIGVANTAIGVLGGFPICHGAGGMGAHARFGARTGGATMIMGGILILLALIPSGAAWIFLIPVPLLGTMLLLDSWIMIKLVGSLKEPEALTVALVIGILSVISRNIALALAVGFLLEKLLKSYTMRRNKHLKDS
jgi:MFS superfamily sulfate permease-like transporter